MGAKNSKKNAAVNQKINGVNVEDVKQAESVVILGTSNSGKSTVFKALQWNENDPWQSPHFVFAHIETIRRFCFDQTSITLEQIKQCHMDETFKAQCQVFELQLQTDNDHLLTNIDKLQPLLVYFWSQNIMKQTFEENNIQNITSDAHSCNIHYFIKRIDEIFSADYMPSKQDILRARSRTTGFMCFEKSVHGTKYRFCDIGGRRSERSKWLLFCLKEARFAIYVCGLDQYGQTLFEDHTANAMGDSLALFDKIVNYKHVGKQQIILLLNKTDLFRECIQKISLKYHYRDYDGADYKEFSKSNIFKVIIKSNEKSLDICIPHNIGSLIGEFCVFLTCEYWIDLCYQNGIEYIKQKYLKCANSTTRILTYETCALNAEQIESIINDAVAHIDRNLELEEVQHEDIQTMILF